jgi:hypothetical protein
MWPSKVSSRLTFWPEAISKASMFTFSSLRSRNLLIPCQSLASANRRFDSHPPLAQSFLVEEGSAVSFHPVYVLLIEVAQDLPSCLTGRALPRQHCDAVG